MAAGGSDAPAHHNRPTDGHAAPDRADLWTVRVGLPRRRIQGGARKHPAWYLNLSADPRVDLQVGAEKFAAVARTADGAERARLWAAMNEIWPSYEDYQEKTDREIPVVVLSRSAPADA